MICKILRLFVNILTGDDKYSLLNSDNFYGINSDAIKQKTFSHFVSTFLQIRLNFNNFEKKDDPDSSCISEIRDCENTWLDKRLRGLVLEDTFDKQHDKRSETLLKSAW